MGDSEKLNDLKRKLRADREESHRKRQKLEEERREAKRIRERLRYQRNKELKRTKESLTDKHALAQHRANSNELNENSGLVDERIAEEGVSENRIEPIVSNKKAVKKSTARKKTSEEKKKLATERQKKHRAKIYADPNLYAKFLASQKKNNLNMKKKGLRSISDMGPMQQKIQRKVWKKTKANYRDKTRKIKNTVSENSNDASTSACPEMPLENSENSAKPKKVKLKKNSLQEKIKKLRDEVSVLQKQNSDLKRNADRHKKRYQRSQKAQKKTEPQSPKKKAAQVMKVGSKEIERQLVTGFALQDQIKLNYDSATTKEKSAMARMLVGSLIKKYKLMNHLSSMMSAKRIQYNKDKPGFILATQIRNKAKIEGLKISIEKFFCDVENTTQSPNVHDVLNFKQQKKLKRYFNDTKRNLKEKFVKLTGRQISFNTFLKHIPFYVVYMKCDARDTCACPDHLNMQLKMDKLCELRVIESKNLSEIMTSLTCKDERSENCMLGWCITRKEKQLKTADYDENAMAFYYEWKRVEEKRVNKQGEQYTFKAMVKQKIPETIGKIVSITNKTIPKCLEHLHNNHNQHQFYKKAKELVDSSTAVLHCDWSENWGTKCHVEPQALHFGGSRVPLSIHTNAIYMWNPVTKAIELIKHCTISEDGRHTAPAVFAHLDPLLQMLMDSGIDTLYVFSDGPTGQYRNKKTFYLLCQYAKKYGFKKVIWNFFEKHHGKGAIDGFGGVIKSTANTKVAQGKDIVDAQSFINVLQDVKIDLSEIKSDEIKAVNSLLPVAPLELRDANGTLQIHQIIWRSDDESHLYLRKRSCLHKDDFSACTKCDLKTPIYCPGPFEMQEKVPKNLPPPGKLPGPAPASKYPGQPKKQNFKRKKNDSLSPNDWVAINEEESKWFVGKIRKIEQVANKKVFSLDNIKIPLGSDKSQKYFKSVVEPNEEKKAFQDDVVLHIKSPKALKKPKNFYSIAEYDQIEKVIKSVSSNHP